MERAVQDKIAKVVIPLAIGSPLFGWLIAESGSAALEAAFVLALAITIPTAVFYLMAEQGWSTLAKRYRSTVPFTGVWQTCTTGQMALVSVDHPEFNQRRLRVVFALQVGTAPDALHLSMGLFSKVPLLGRFFPDVRIPWEAVTSARTYEAPGWIKPQGQPGAVFQAAYDPNYRGTFVEMQAGEPPVFIQLPLDILGDAPSHLGLSHPS